MSIESNIPAESLLFAGEDKALSYEVLAAGSTTLMEDVTGYSLQWTMKGDAATVTKTIGSGVTITGVYNVARASNTQRVNVAISDTDTETLAPGRYQIALKRLDAGVEAILSHGVLQLLVAAIR